MKTVLITGDLVWDTHIARLPRVGRGYHLPHGYTQLRNRYGGAWYLKGVIEGILGATKTTGSFELFEPHRAEHEAIEIDEGEKRPCGIAKAFSVWEWFEEKIEGKTTKLWRIKEFLGCQAARWDKKTEPCHTMRGCPKHTDVLVIDDLALGFADHDAAWPQCLRDGKPPGIIVAKATPAFDRPLWRKLLTREWASRLTLVVSANALRDAGARLSRGLSWDQSVEEARALIEPGGACWPLRYCHRVVITFGYCGAAVFSREPQAPGTQPAELAFERFVFDPSHLEGTWLSESKGEIFGTASFIVAAMVEHELAPMLNTAGVRPKASAHIAVSRGLAAARALHCTGAGGNAGDFMPGTGNAVEADIWSCLINAKPEAKPEKTFRSAFDRRLLDLPQLPDTDENPASQTLLTDVLGASRAFLTVAAEEIVRHGVDKALHGVPRVSFDKYFTVDREEIERLNILRNLIDDYRASATDSRPLSIAVFGQPGSGKSFAIKQLANHTFGKDKAILTFNLSQMESVAALHEAFHEVRDKSVKGQLPLVFWDEFDAAREKQRLGWLKEFLAPMQDAEFLANGHVHPFGKCIFVFAGGTAHTFDAFAGQDKNDGGFANVKGPDFISRLRGYVDIKGPNPSGTGDDVHIVRRAILLRALIELHHPGFVQSCSGGLRIHGNVLHAFLNAQEYKHGARSMEAIMSLSRPASGRRFGPSELPPREVVELHASADFFQIACDTAKTHLDPGEVERVAEIKHEGWCLEKRKAGYVFAPVRNDRAKPPAHHLLRPYGELHDADQERNRRPARLLLMRLAAFGYGVCPKDQVKGGGVSGCTEDVLERLARSEHRRWMREQLVAGGAFATQSNDALLLHQDICKFDSLSHKEQHLDRAIVSAFAKFLDESGFILVKKKPTTRKEIPRRTRKS